jgi:hypothetical protein
VGILERIYLLTLVLNQEAILEEIYHQRSIELFMSEAALRIAAASTALVLVRPIQSATAIFILIHFLKETITLIHRLTQPFNESAKLISQ